MAYIDENSGLILPSDEAERKMMLKSLEELEANYSDFFSARDIYKADEEQNYIAFTRYIEENPPTPRMIYLLLEIANKNAQAQRSRIATNAADALHSKPGGNRDKAEQIRKIWDSGKYTSRDICAEQECAAIGMAFSTARKALRNTPAPTKPNAGE